MSTIEEGVNRLTPIHQHRLLNGRLGWKQARRPPYMRWFPQQTHTQFHMIDMSIFAQAGRVSLKFMLAMVLPRKRSTRSLDGTVGTSGTHARSGEVPRSMLRPGTIIVRLSSALWAACAQTAPTDICWKEPQRVGMSRDVRDLLT